MFERQEKRCGLKYKHVKQVLTVIAIDHMIWNIALSLISINVFLKFASNEIVLWDLRLQCPFL